MPSKKSPKKRNQHVVEVRKLAAIMFTDMVGYSALAQRNEKLALELLEEHKRLLRMIFARHRGHEIKTIGDAFLVEFSSALDATQCAVEIQKVLQQRNERSKQERIIQIRIGIHVGDIVYREKDVFGDGVNIASRIEPIAGAGGICLSEDVARQVQNKIDYALIRLGRGELKNIEVPVGIYKVLLPWQQGRLPMSDRIGFIMRQRRSRTFVVVIGLLIFMIGLSWMIFQNYLTKVSVDSTLSEKSIAVLPFQNFGGGPENDYFVDGMTESLITDLAKIQGLFVIARNSMFQYKGKPVKVRDVGKDLKVRFVLEGSVQRSGGKVRVNAQLIDALTEAHVWSDRYDREVKDIFALQDDISMNIIRALELKLSENEQSKMRTERTSSVDAQELYWKGLQYSRRRTKADSDSAIKYLDLAVKHDPAYAAAHATLASTLRFRYAFGLERQPVVLERAKQELATALALNPTLPEAMLVKGLILREEGDLAGAIQTLQKELEENPNDAQCLYYLGNAFRDVGDFMKAVQFHKRAFDREPLYFWNAYNLAIDYWQLREEDNLWKYTQKAIELDSAHFLGTMLLGYALAFQSKEKEAVAAMTKAIVSEPNHLDSYGARAEVYKQFGMFDKAINDLTYLFEKDPYSLTGLSSAFPLLLNLNKYRDAERIIQTFLTRPVLPLGQGVDSKSFVWLYRGVLKEAQGDKKEAQASYKEARSAIERNLDRFPESPALRSAYGLILGCQGEFSRAAEEVEKAIRTVPSQYDYTFDLARVYALSNNKSKMLQYLQKTIDLGRLDLDMMKMDVFLKNFRRDKDFRMLFQNAQNKQAARQ